MISVRSEVQVLPGPPSFPTGRVSGAVAQLGERLLCKQDVVGSIPSGSTIPGVERMIGHSYKKFVEGSCLPLVLHDIVKRRFVRVPYSEPGLEGRKAFRKWLGDDGYGPSSWTLNPRHMMGKPNRAPGLISRSWSFCADLHRDKFFEFARRASAMRTIKCLKGNWWMPWHAQAMKDVIRCDKLRGGANTL